MNKNKLITELMEVLTKNNIQVSKIEIDEYTYSTNITIETKKEGK